MYISFFKSILFDFRNNKSRILLEIMDKFLLLGILPVNLETLPTVLRESLKGITQLRRQTSQLQTQSLINQGARYLPLAHGVTASLLRII